MPLILTVAQTAEPPIRSGVYAICSRSTGLVYVGSAVRIQKRWRDHRQLLRKGQHHSWHFQRAWNSGGEQDFEFLVLQYVPRDQLLAIEQRYIDARSERLISASVSTLIRWPAHPSVVCYLNLRRKR